MIHTYLRPLLRSLWCFRSWPSVCLVLWSFEYFRITTSWVPDFQLPNTQLLDGRKFHRHLPINRAKSCYGESDENAIEGPTGQVVDFWWVKVTTLWQLPTAIVFGEDFPSFLGTILPLSWRSRDPWLHEGFFAVFFRQHHLESIWFFS